MEPNVGATDAAVRLAACSVAAIASLDAVVYFEGTTRWVAAGALAAVAVLAGVTGGKRSCPLYGVLRFSTAEPRPAKH